MTNTVEIGGQQRPVKYNFNAFIEFEEITGIDLTAGANEDQFKKIKNLRALVFVGLKHGARYEKQEFDHTIEDVGGWLSFGDGTTDKFLSSLIKDSKPDNGEPNDNAESEKK